MVQMQARREAERKTITGKGAFGQGKQEDYVTALAVAGTLCSAASGSHAVVQSCCLLATFLRCALVEFTRGGGKAAICFATYLVLTLLLVACDPAMSAYREIPVF